MEKLIIKNKVVKVQQCKVAALQQDERGRGRDQGQRKMEDMEKW